MIKDRLRQIALALLNVVADFVAALWEMVFLNPRMTALGAASAVTFAAAHYGLNLTHSQERHLAVLIMLFLGSVGRQKKRGDAK